MPKTGKLPKGLKNIPRLSHPKKLLLPQLLPKVPQQYQYEIHLKLLPTRRILYFALWCESQCVLPRQKTNKTLYLFRQVTNTSQFPKQPTNLPRPRQFQRPFLLYHPNTRRPSFETSIKRPTFQTTQPYPTQSRQRNRPYRTSRPRPQTILQRTLSQTSIKRFPLFYAKNTNILHKDLYLRPMSTLTKKRGTSPRPLYTSHRSPFLQRQTKVRRPLRRRTSPTSQTYLSNTIMHQTITLSGTTRDTGYAVGEGVFIGGRSYYTPEGPLW